MRFVKPAFVTAYWSGVQPSSVVWTPTPIGSSLSLPLGARVYDSVLCATGTLISTVVGDDGSSSTFLICYDKPSLNSQTCGLTREPEFIVPLTFKDKASSAVAAGIRLLNSKRDVTRRRQNRSRHDPLPSGDTAGPSGDAIGVAGVVDDDVDDDPDDAYAPTTLQACLIAAGAVSGRNSPCRGPVPNLLARFTTLNCSGKADYSHLQVGQTVLVETREGSLILAVIVEKHNATTAHFLCVFHLWKNLYINIRPLFSGEQKYQDAWSKVANSWWDLSKYSDIRLRSQWPCLWKQFTRYVLDNARLVPKDKGDMKRKALATEWLAKMGRRAHQWAACFTWAVFTQGADASSRAEVVRVPNIMCPRVRHMSSYPIAPLV